ncbi:MAG: GspE/PulE family protein [Rubripirellula sp.]
MILLGVEPEGLLMKDAHERFEALLLKRNLCSLDQLSECRGPTPVDTAGKLTSTGYADAVLIGGVLAEVYGFGFIDLKDSSKRDCAIELLPESIAREHKVFPLEEREGSLVILIHDPTQLELMDQIRFMLNREITFTVATKEAIQEAINFHYRQAEGESMDTVFHDMTETQIDFHTPVYNSDEGEFDEDANSPAAKLVQIMIQEASRAHASDIHIEPFENRIRVRYRIDGTCTHRSDLPKRLLANVISRIKVLGEMDITNKRIPDDGRIEASIGDKRLDLRVSTIPTSHGTACVMRLLDRENLNVGLTQLGLSKSNHAKFVSLIRRPSGIILVTGPTGSGKTTTLYSAIQSLNTIGRKIITAEDPVEYQLPGINQCEVNRSLKVPLDFPDILRSMLRQAPNVILIGEIRDNETAKAAFQAAQTGHLVFSTLHTNNAPLSISRLSEIGLKPYVISSGLSAVLAQRLVRTICPRCKAKDQPSAALLRAANIPSSLLDKADFHRGKGCAHCAQTGFYGRVGIYELMSVNGALRTLISKGASTKQVREQAIQNGMVTLYAEAIQKACQGITTIDEVYRVAAQSESESAAFENLAESRSG